LLVLRFFAGMFPMRVVGSLLLLALFISVSPLRSATPFPQAESDLKPDPKAHFGTLPNGLRYIVRANKEPKERAALRLLVETGALQEREDQRGLAHFLEHMAFNGSEHYAPGTLVEFFQRMGMNFGGDTNASTGFERTLYLLELPDTKPATLAEGMRVFSDYAGGLLLKPEEIDKERGIILSEKRTRDSVGYRTLVARLEFLLDGTLFPKRLPIGETEVIQKSQRDRFVDYYNTWYRPELMTIVAVGDFDPAAVEKLIVDTFTPLKERAPAPPKPDWGKIASREGVSTFYHYESEAPNTTVAISTITPYQREPDTAANRIKYLPRSLAHAMLNRRISILAKKENAPFISGGASVGEAYNFYREASMALTCREDQWEAALGVADQELRRALEFGFQPAELKEVVANFRNSLEQAVKTESTRRSDALADEIADTIVDRSVFTTPADDLALYAPALDKVTVDDCLKAMRESWSAKHRLVLVTGNAKVGETAAKDAAEKTIASVYEKTHAVAVTPPEKIEELKWAYTDFGAAGKIAKREHVDDLDITLITFENGVRLNLKKTDFEANRIRMTVRVGSGQITEPRDKPGLAFYTGQTYVEGGLGKHSVDDLRQILAGKTVGAGFGPGIDAFVVNGATNREDLLLEMQLIAARITDPGFRPEAARQARKAIEQMYLSFEHTANGPFNLEVSRLLASGDPRFGLPPKA
jgi:zinc protease